MSPRALPVLLGLPLFFLSAGPPPAQATRSAWWLPPPPQCPRLVVAPSRRRPAPWVAALPLRGAPDWLSERHLRQEQPRVYRMAAHPESLLRSQIRLMEELPLLADMGGPADWGAYLWRLAQVMNALALKLRWEAQGLRITSAKTAPGWRLRRTRPPKGLRAQIQRRRAAWWNARALRTYAQIFVNRARQQGVRVDAVRFAMGDLEARLAAAAIGRRDAAALRRHAMQMERHFLRLATQFPRSRLIYNAWAVAADLTYGQRRFRRAQALYASLAREPRPRLARYARYRMAWCLVRLGHRRAARRLFRWVARRARRSGLLARMARQSLTFLTQRLSGSPAPHVHPSASKDQHHVLYLIRPGDTQQP